jgi:hypothetical protein
LDISGDNYDNRETYPVHKNESEAYQDFLDSPDQAFYRAKTLGEERKSDIPSV